MPGDDVAPPPSGRAGTDSSATAEVGLIGRLLTLLLQGMPLIFGIGFIAPLIAQLLERALPEAAAAPWPMLIGLAIGGSWGAFANLKGRWI